MINSSYSWTCVLLLPLAWLAPAIAQESGAPASIEPEIEFVEGDAWTGEVPADLRGIVNVVSTFETPAIDESEEPVRSRRKGIGGSLSLAVRGAVEAVIADASARAPDCRVRRQPHLRRSPYLDFIRYETVRSRETDVKTVRWWVYGCDEAMVRALTLELAQAYHRARVERLKMWKTDLEEAREGSEGYRQKTEAMEERLKKARSALSELGEESVGKDLATQTIARLFHQKRLAEIALVGIQASLDAVEQRLPEARRRGLVRGPDLEAVAELLSQLGGMQVRFDIELVGTVARRDRIAREIELFQDVLNCKTWEEGIAKRHEKTERSLQRYEVAEQDIEGMEETLHLAIVDDRVVTSAIVRDDGPTEP